MARLTWRMRTAKTWRGNRCRRRDFLSVVMKCPFSQDGPGSPVSPGSNRKVVGPSTPWLPNGTIRTESVRHNPQARLYRRRNHFAHLDEKIDFEQFRAAFEAEHQPVDPT